MSTVHLTSIARHDHTIFIWSLVSIGSSTCVPWEVNKNHHLTLLPQRILNKRVILTPDTRLSSIGYVFLVNGGAVSWRSTKSPLQVLNAAEAEIVSLSSAAQEGVFLRKLCIKMGFPQHSPTIIYEDCEAAVALSKETRFRKRSKHIALR